MTGKINDAIQPSITEFIAKRDSEVPGEPPICDTTFVAVRQA
jgi:hypothetical protein